MAGSGAAGWVVDKLLGPSADELGNQIKIFASDRLAAIFSAIGRKRKAAEHGALPPGFSVSAIQKASVSDNDPNLTEMWANLLIAAADNYKSRHMVFADILSQIGPEEAQLLKKLAGKRDPDIRMDSDDIRRRFRTSLDSMKIKGRLDRREANDLLDPIEKVFDALPVSFESVKVLIGASERQSAHLYKKDETVSCLVLERQNLVKSTVFEYSAGAVGPFPITATAFVLTELGLEFVNVCEGV